MKTYKLKSTKHSDLLMIGDKGGPSTVNVVTRLKPTEHGMLFRALVEKVVPEAYRLIDGDLGYDTPDRARQARKVTAENAVHFCEEAVNAVVEAMTRNKALGAVMPSYDALMAILDPPEPVTTADVLRMVGDTGQ